MNDENFFGQYPNNPYNSPYPLQQLNKGERYVMRKRTDFWGNEIVEFYVTSQADDAPFYKIVAVIFFLSLVMFFFSKCDNSKSSKMEPTKANTEQVN